MRIRRIAAGLTVTAFIFACATLAHGQGQAQEQDQTQAQDGDFAALQAAATQGDAQAQFALGNRYYLGRGVGQDDRQAMAWYRQAAAQGFPPAENQLGYMFENGQGVLQDIHRARDWYNRAAKQGDARAEYNLGEMYEHGRGVGRDYRRALDLYFRAAEQGDPDAEQEVGYFYQCGYGVNQDYGRAFNWYQKSAAQGNGDAENQLGYMAEEGMGQPQDYQVALAWYTKAAEQGNDNGEENLGYMYQHGLGVPRDYAQAQEWFYKAAGQGNTNAENQLGWMYQFAQGVPQDFGQALAWYRTAANQGNGTAQDNLNALTEKLRSGEAGRWEVINTAAEQDLGAQSERQRQIAELYRKISQLELDAEQDDSLAAQFAQPSSGNGAAIMNAIGTVGAVKYQVEATQDRLEAARLRKQLEKLNEQPEISAPVQPQAAPPARPDPPAAQTASVGGSGCAGSWKTDTFQVTAGWNEQLYQEAGITARITGQDGHAAIRGGFLSISENSSLTSSVYYGFNGVVTEQMSPGQSLEIPVQAPSDPNRGTIVSLAVRYCAAASSH